MRSVFRRPLSAVAPAHASVVFQCRFVNVNPNLQRKQTQEFYNSTKLTDFDVDKEKWGKQQQWHTMDCVLDPTVEFPARWSIKGLRKRFSLWLTMRKVVERRPGFMPAVELRQNYIDYKKVAFTSDHNQLKLLCKHTTWTEATRIEEETKKLQLEMEHKQSARSGGKPTSWKSMSVKPRSVAEFAPTSAPSSSTLGGAEAPSADGAATTSGAAAAGEEVLDVKTPLMEVKIDSFDVKNVYIGQMTNEDWVQITCHVKGKYRTPKTAPIFETLEEFPVFELKMGDGVNNTNNNPFIVVAIMDRDGARYGKDGNDAASLRKSLSQSKKNSWF